MLEILVFTVLIIIAFIALINPARLKHLQIAKLKSKGHTNGEIENMLNSVNPMRFKIDKNVKKCII